MSIEKPHRFDRCQREAADNTRDMLTKAFTFRKDTLSLF